MKESFRYFIKNEHISVKYAKGVSDMEGKEFHPYNEIIYFMGGSGSFISDNLHLDLVPELLIVIPKESYHQMCISGDRNEYHRLVIHFGGVPELEAVMQRRLKQVCAAKTDTASKYLLDKLLDIAVNRADDSDNEAVINAVLTLLLDELSDNAGYDELIGRKNTLSYKFVNWIDKNIGDRITVEMIAQEFNMSRSGVAHAFRKEMNISIYQYILKKRLTLAHNQILDGKNPTDVALGCGFGDYSGFYKQYKKMFGYAPSAFRNKNAEL